MPLNPEQLLIIKAEALAMARELPQLTPERQERQCRMLAIFLAEADLERQAEAARHHAVTKAGDIASHAYLVQTLEEVQ